MIYTGPGFLAVEWFGSTPTPSPRLPPHSKTEKERQIAAGREGGRRWACSRITEPQESLILYKLFNTRWCNSSRPAFFYNRLRSKCLMTKSTKFYTTGCISFLETGIPRSSGQRSAGRQLAAAGDLYRCVSVFSAVISHFNCISTTIQ